MIKQGNLEIKFVCNVLFFFFWLCMFICFGYGVLFIFLVCSLIFQLVLMKGVWGGRRGN